MAKQPTSLSLNQRLYSFLASPKFFWGVFGFATLSAVWVAVSSLYPMAFDEDFHLGMIRLYAEHWGPFSLVQRPDANRFGAIVVDPSYLYHYLMSFPYRFLRVFTDSEMAIVIILRLMNVVFFAWALWLYRKVLQRVGLGNATTNSILAVFILVPVLPVLAGQINYDNLLLLVMAGSLLLAITIYKELETRRAVPAKPLLYLLLLLLFGATVKYAFLPIAAGIVAYLAFIIWRRSRSDKKLLRKSWQNIVLISTRAKVLVATIGVILLVLAGQRYGTNLVKYHDPVPDCGAVLTVGQCTPYGPWGRDHSFAETANQRPTKDPVSYTVIDWLPGMWRRLYFAIAGPTIGYDTQKPLPIPSILAIVVVLGGLALFIRYAKEIFKEYPLFWLFLIPSLLYLIAVWQQVYKEYIYTAWPMAINGRYVLPFLPLFGAFFAIACLKFLRARNWSKYGAIIAVVVLVLFLQGGGIITYVVRSQPSWFWPNSWMKTTNDGLRAGLKPVVYEGGGWFGYRGGP